ncbi:hypothetical protein GOP47_0023198 [Adiantum capillus-veneris]|uniref:PWWP domain-containing protein n=1 Tax=Adiantum capillus-veneris TaxID=13818 RepID=A0A9D4U6W2_ADICA|nr:hypothetical protein GOP47_0023198 [Adiantum capillus-veneris]
MQEQGKHHSSGVKSFFQEPKKLKATGSASVSDEAKSLEKHAKGPRVIFSSDAERKLDGIRYRLGDMVWAKVKSHPWWPGQLYDPALASASAMEFKRDSCFLVAFFGDSTFGWFAEEELIPYEPNFAQKSRQTSAHNFVDAVEDSLDEMRRRVKLGLTCHCSSSEEASERGGKRAGLLYDRQLRDIRRNFEPAKLLSAIKQLACSPFSSSQNMLRTTVSGAQTDAFRLLVLCKKPEHKEIEGSESLQSSRIKGHHSDAIGLVGVLKDKTLPEKIAIKKPQPKMPLLPKSIQEQKECSRKEGLQEKRGGMDELGNIKQHPKGVTIKKRSTDKSKDISGDKGITGDTVLEKRSVQPVECGVQDKKTMSAFVDKEIQASKAASKEKGIRESGQIPYQLESYMTSNASISEIPGSEERDSLTPSHSKAQQRKLKKSAALAVKSISKVVPEAEGMELVVTEKEPNAALKRTTLEEDQFLKLKPTKKFVVADAELSQARKKVKVVSLVKDKVVKQPKRVVKDEPTDATLREIKKRKLLSDSIGKDNSDDRLCDHVGVSTASDSQPTSEFPQLSDNIISGPVALESNLEYLQVEAFPGETGGISPAETLEMIGCDAGQLHQEVVLLHKHVNDDATEAQNVGAGFVMQPNESDADAAVDSAQAEINSSVSKKEEEKVKDSNLLEHRALLPLQAEIALDTSKKKEKTLQDTNIIDLCKPGGLSNHDHNLKGQQEGKSLETPSQLIEDETVKGWNASPIEADPSLAHFHGSRAVHACAEDLHPASQAASTVKYGQEERKLSKNMVSKHIPPSNKVSSSKKRVVEECSLKANKKRIKTLSMDRAGECHADFEEHGGLNRQDEEVAHLQNLHEGLMSVAAKPLDAVEKEFSSNVCRAFTNFRKVVYKKAVYHAGPENLISSAAASEEVVGVGNGDDKMAEFVIEQVGVKAIRSKDAEAEPKGKDARIQKGIECSVGQKQSEEDSPISQSRPTKRSVTTLKPPSSSSISLRPAFEAKIPVRVPKEVLNRFGQRVPRLLDASEKMTSLSNRVESNLEERALVVSFPRGLVLPPEKQLREVFAKFGDLNVPRTRVDSKNGCAYVVFRHTQDAEAALISMKENSVFENARFWLKPRDADRKEMAKISSRSKALSDRPVMSSGQLAEAKIVSDTERNKTASDRGLLVGPNNVGPLRVVDSIGLNQNVASRRTEVGGEEGALPSKHVLENATLSVIYASASEKAPIGVLGPGQGKLDGIQPGAVAPSSVVLRAGPRSLASPIASDISEEFLALLRQLHELVVSTGFVM